ncbi:MAG: UvrD-helicase domain-containing protein [Treponema sp.]|nr:UvrD-helicase domain-containing protein [Treponema sp.]
MNLEYLNLLKRKLDEQQMLALTAPGNVIVAAGAGSGKTQVLATRFAYLVMSFGIKADRILTLTFTKKAASEMYQRIYKTLEFFANHPEVPDVEKKRAQEAIADFAKVHIQTLDSYNASVLKQCASRYGIRPDFTQGDMENGNLALEYVMKNRDSDVVHYLVNEKNFGNLQEIACDIQKEIMLRSSLASDPDNFEKLCRLKKEGCIKMWNENIPKLLSLINEFNKTYDLSFGYSRTMEENKLKIDNLEEYIKILPDDFSSYNSSLYSEIADNLGNFKLSTQYLKGNDEDLKFIVQQFRGQDNPNASVPVMLMSAAYLRDFDSFLSYSKFLDAFMKEVNKEKRSSGSLSFSDISEMALKALMEQEDLRTQEQNAYDRIMIDEFQDNNSKNRNLLFLLSGKPGLKPEEILRGRENLMPDKLFFVGDDKQSIYKFRGADVSVFKQLGEDLNTEPVNMVFNYRSTEYLLDSFNQIFGGFNNLGERVKDFPEAVFPETVEQEKTFEATFTGNQISKRNMEVLERSEKTFKNSPVHFCVYDNEFPPDCEEIAKIVSPYQRELEKLGKASTFEDALKNAFISNVDQQCFYVANEIANRIKESDGNLSYSDFAILDRSRGMRKTLVKYLSYFDIPYNLDAQTDIFGSAPVNDIYNLLRLCVYPSDRKSLASFLCSPFAGLSVNDVEIIFSNDFELGKRQDQIIEIIRQYLSVDKFELFMKALDLFEKIKKEATGNLLAETISNLWYQYGYRYETLWHKSFYVESENYDLLFELARKCDTDGVSLSYFIDQMEALQSEYTDSDLDVKEISYPKEIGNAVEVMTIHKSKGLQFKYVFIMGVSKDGKGDYSEKDEQVTVETPFGDSSSVETEKAKAEFRRLVYVALTRAEKEAWVIIDAYNNVNSIMMKLLKAYYPEMEKNPAYSLGEFTMKDGAPFDYMSIMPVDRNTIKNGRKDVRPAILSVKHDFINKNKNIFDDVEIITLDSQIEPNPVVAPSTLEKKIEDAGSAINLGDSLVPELKILMPKLMEKNFNSAHFGTFAHAFMESYVRDSENVLHNLPARAFRNLWDFNKTEEENFKNPLCEQMISVCMKMCKAFEESVFAKELKTSSKKHPEYSFIARQNDCIVNGTIDLCYERQDGKVVVVDYKTDEEIHPDIYYPQLTCYKDAAAELYGVEKSEVECYLFYLRYGQAVNVTDFASDELLPHIS